MMAAKHILHLRNLLRQPAIQCQVIYATCKALNCFRMRKCNPQCIFYGIFELLLRDLWKVTQEIRKTIFTSPLNDGQTLQCRLLKRPLLGDFKTNFCDTSYYCQELQNIQFSNDLNSSILKNSQNFIIYSYKR